MISTAVERIGSSAMWRVFAGWSMPTRLVVGLLVLGAALTGFGIALHEGVALLSDDPCLDDWDISCSSTGAGRLSLLQIPALMVLGLGFLLLRVMILVAVAVAVVGLVRRFRSRRMADLR